MDQNKIPMSVSVLISGIIIVSAVIYSQKVDSLPIADKIEVPSVAGFHLATGELGGKAKALLTEIIPPAEVLSAEIILPVSWGDLGKEMVDSGVIDAKKFEELYAGRGGLNIEEKKLLFGTNNKEIRMTQENAGTILNLLWAFGLGNKNEILEKGPMVNYDGREAGSPAEALAKAGNFASTGGWTLAKGNAMDHYSKHSFVTLTPDQQAMVERVAKNIYRPCCGNSTYFPDCNHGMAMLGLLELLASNGVSERDMYKIALQVNSYWFPDTYLTIAKYMELKGVPWNKVDPKEMLGADYSSGSGYRKILEQVAPVESKSAGGCGV